MALSEAGVFAEVLGEIIGSVTATVTERAVGYLIAPLAYGMIIEKFVDVSAAAAEAERFPGENYVTPFEALRFLADLMVFGARLSVISPELGEMISEGLGEDLVNALQHVTTEPLERMFAVRFGAENIDSDDLTEAYAWGMLRPEMFAWLAAVDGLSNSAAMASFAKALGEKYSGDFRAVEDAAGAAAAKSITLALDPADKLYSEARSALFGLPEATRTAANDVASEVARLYTEALRRSMDALAYRSAARYVDNAKLQQQFLNKAAAKLAEARGFIDAAEALEKLVAGYEAAVEAEAERLAAELAEAYRTIRGRYAEVLSKALESAAELAKRVQGDVKAEYDRFATVLSDIRGSAPDPVPSNPRAVRVTRVKVDIVEVG